MELVGYDNLTKFQRRWVDNMIEIYPDLVSGGAITLEQCTEGIVKLKEKHLIRDNVMYISYNMSALITALDKQSNVQTGENGHSEIGWSKSIDNDSIREKITQFYFQLCF